jgi:hypothetical protein
MHWEACKETVLSCAGLGKTAATGSDYRCVCSDESWDKKQQKERIKREAERVCRLVYLPAFLIPLVLAIVRAPPPAFLCARPCTYSRIGGAPPPSQREGLTAQDLEQKAAEAAAAAAEVEKQKTRIKFCSAGNLNPDDLRKEMNVERQRRSFIRDDDDAAYRVSPEEKVRRAIHARTCAHTHTHEHTTHARTRKHTCIHTKTHTRNTQTHKR